MPNRIRTKPASVPAVSAKGDVPAQPPAANSGIASGLGRVWPSVRALLEREAAVALGEVPGDLTARTAERILAYRAAARPATLNDADGATLDAMLLAIASGRSDESTLLPTDLAERRGGVANVLALLERDGAEGMNASDVPADLTARTMEAIRADRQRKRFAEQIDMLRQGPPSAGVSLRQIFSAAAILLLGVTLLLPVMERSRTSAMQQACAGNLSLAGQAFNAYAADHGGAFPRAASMPGSSWWNVGGPDAVMPDGTVRSNSAHLYRLVRAGYLPADRLACQGNTDAPRHGQMTVSQWDWSSPLSVSYSYQNQFTPEVLKADNADPGLAVLADKNPLFVPRGNRLAFDPAVRITDASRQHGGAGQNALRIDGSASWTIVPNFAQGQAQAQAQGGGAGPDVFWAVGSMPRDHRYTGRELPDDVARDAFLVP